MEKIDSSVFSGNLRKDDNEKSRDCWTLSDGNNFRVRSKDFLYDRKNKVLFHLLVKVLLVLSQINIR
jgi:hypothetical protein